MTKMLTRLIRGIAAPVVRTALLLLTIGGVQPAFALTGTITGTLDERLYLSRCADGYGYPEFRLTLKAGQKFSVTNGTTAYTGSFTQNAARTALVMTLDSASRIRLASAVARSASRLCGATVAVSNYTAPIFRVYLRYGASRTSTCNISGSMTVYATGRSAYGSGSAKYQVSVWQACFRGQP